MVSLTSHVGGAVLGTQQAMLATYVPMYLFRTAATIGALLWTYYADRYPTNKAINFGSFIANTLILFSWLGDWGLYGAYQGWTKSGGSVGNSACAAGTAWCSM